MAAMMSSVLSPLYLVNLNALSLQPYDDLVTASNELFRCVLRL